MSVAEKIGYLRGLAEGLDLEHTAETKEEKLILALIDAVEELADQVAECGEHNKALTAQIEDLAESVDVVETLVLDGIADEDETFDEYEIECPTCGEMLIINEDALDSGVISCPSCETKFEIDLGFDHDEDID